MFNKKPRRNFRQRKANSSDEEDDQKNRGDGEENEKAPAAVNKPSKLAQVRGITCSSKREPTPPKPDSSDGEDGETLEVTEEREERNKDSDGFKTKTNSILSFSDDKEGNVNKCQYGVLKSIFSKMDPSHTFNNVTQREVVQTLEQHKNLKSIGVVLTRLKGI